MKNRIAFMLLAILSTVPPTFAQNTGKGKKPSAEKPAVKPGYKKNEIAKARFGDKDRRSMVKKAYTIMPKLKEKIIGQDRTIKTLQDRVVQFLESFGSRKKDPISLHMIGFPGIGKSAMVQLLEELGFKIIKLDAQKFTGEERSWEIDYAFQNIKNECEDKPCIVLVDELDKLPEITKDGEKTRHFIGALNQILTDGSLSNRDDGDSTSNFSNVMFISTMNFNPDDIQKYSKEALGVEKNFYQMTIEDFQKYDLWLNLNPSARYMVLSSLFRTNTVSRLAPNTVILKPLSNEDYDQIAANMVRFTVERLTQGENGGKRVTVGYTDKFVKYLRDKSVFAPSGARETVYKVDALAEQVVNAAIKVKSSSKKEESLDRPRKVKIDVSEDGLKVQVTVTPVFKRKKDYVDMKPITFEMTYDANSRQMSMPTELIAVDAPKTVDKENKERADKITQKDIVSTRFPKGQGKTKELSQTLNKVLIGQEVAVELVKNEMRQYLGRKEPAAKEPMYKIFAGFPGIGKSELVMQTAAYLEIPVVRVNMQQYSSDSSDTVQSFLAELNDKINVAKQKRPDGKFFVVIEEMDKTFEKHPQSGEIINRPIMSTIKDLLADGVIRTKVKDGNYDRDVEINIRAAYTFVTMNFASEIFQLKADPRLTTTEDMLGHYEMLSTRPADLRNVLSRIYLPETISRMLPHFVIMKPLSNNEYRQLINTVSSRVEMNRLVDQKTRKNNAQITLELTPAYKEYLFNETVIPSEGARYTVMAAAKRIADDLEMALKNFKKSAPYAKKPVTLKLDFDPKKNEIISRVIPIQEKKSIEIARYPVALTFPRPEMAGSLPEERVIVALHEFGHAFAAIRLGLRFEVATVIPPETGTGGYVKYKGEGIQKAEALIARLYSALASRAMERIWLAENPKDPKAVMQITIGSSSDIEGASSEIFSLLYELGVDPEGGTIFKSRSYSGAPTGFADLDQKSSDALGRVMRRMEEAIVEDFLKAFDKDWYMKQIMEFGRRGTLTEKQFYEMLGFVYPGDDNALFAGQDPRLQKNFKENVQKLPENLIKAMEFKQGATKTTSVENMSRMSNLFHQIISEELHGKPACELKLVDPKKPTEHRKPKKKR